MRKTLAATCLAGALTLGTGAANAAGVPAQTDRAQQSDQVNDDDDSGKLGLLGLLGLAGLAGLLRRPDQRADAYRGDRAGVR